MIEYSKVDLNTGRILYFGELQLSVFHRQPDVIEGRYDDSTYWAPGLVPTPRPVLSFDKVEILANGEDEAVAIDLPVPFIVDIDGEEYQTTDGSFEFSTDVPGTYVITPKTFPYREEPVEVVAL